MKEKYRVVFVVDYIVEAESKGEAEDKAFERFERDYEESD